jgi:hypothetical protein
LLVAIFINYNIYTIVLEFSEIYTNNLNSVFSKYFKRIYGLKVNGLDVTELYLLNLVVTSAMFIVLVFRAWLELKHYQLIWKELEWRETYEVASRILEAEKDIFMKVEGGQELYEILSEMFKNKEPKGTK